MGLLKDCVPPLVVAAYRRWLRPYGFRGDYPSWAVAQARAVGYADDQVLQAILEFTGRLRAAELAVAGSALALAPHRLNWPLIAACQRAALRHAGQVTVLDFGGALGGMYWLHRHLLADVAQLHWQVVEQPHLVACGQAEYQDAHLKFFATAPAAAAARPAQVLLLGSVLQYLPEPYVQLDALLALAIPQVIVDRQPCSRRGRDELTVQVAYPAAAHSSYPAWLLDPEHLHQTFVRHNYHLADRFTPNDHDWRADYRGLVYHHSPT